MKNKKQASIIIRSTLALALSIWPQVQARSAMPAKENMVTTAAMEPSSMARIDPYFTAINYTLPKDTLMLMLLPDYQLARTSGNFLTAMAMAQYGLTDYWTTSLMIEGEKIAGLPATYGGMRLNTYFHIFPNDHLLNFTLYGEYEYLNEAALYKMEIAGFGSGDLSEPLSEARRTRVRTFEQRVIVYHDWDRFNATFNFISETGFDTHENDFGYAWGIFLQPMWVGMDTGKPMAGMTGMTGMDRRSTPPFFSLQRLGFGLEMMGGLGNSQKFGFYWQNQQHYLGPVFSYTLAQNWNFRVESAFGLSRVSDPFVLRMGLDYSIDQFLYRLGHSR
jgi:hypothetical protein